MQLIVEKRGHRVLPMMALVALLGLALLVGLMNVSAGHKADLLELDVVSGASGTCTTPFASGLCDDANTFNNGAVAGFDWQDVCTTYAARGLTPPAGKFGGDITSQAEAALAALGVTTASCVDDYHKGGNRFATGGDHTYFDQDKDEHDISGATPHWGCVSQSTPTPKDEILNGYSIQAIAPSGPVAGHVINYFGIERDKNEGTAFNGVWFMQAGASCFNNTNAKVDFSGGPHVARCGTPTAPCPAGRTPADRGDILVLTNYSGGGRIASVFVVEWSPGSNSGAGDTCFEGGQAARVAENLCLIAESGDCADEIVGAPSPGGTVPATDKACAVVNTRNFTNPATASTHPLAPWNNNCVASGPNKCVSGTRVTIETNQFFEGTLDLTQLLCTPGVTCNIPCFSTYLAETRSSAEFSATLKDFVRGEFDTCTGAIRIEKVDESGPPPVHLAGACFSINPGALSVCDNNPAIPPITTNATDDDPAVGVVCVDGLASGDYTVTETVVPSGYAGDPGSPTATVPSPLTNNIVCPNGPTGSAIVTFVNKLGSIQWEKRSDVTGNLQGGAQFSISPNPFACHQPPDPNPGIFTDNSGPDADTHAGQVKINNVCLGTYTITEETAPSGFAKDPDATRSVTVSAAEPNPVIGSPLVDPPGGDTQGRDDCPDTTGDTDTDEADFCNIVASLYWEKRGKDASTPETGNELLPGFGFTVTGTGVNVVVSDCRQAPCPTGGDQNPGKGQFCLAQMPLGVLLTIDETSKATGYIQTVPANDGDLTKTLTSSSQCSSPPSSANDAGDFINQPLSKFEIKFICVAPSPNDASKCATLAKITCPNPAISPTPDDTTPTAFDDIDEIYGNATSTLLEGTYNCEIVIDP